MAEFAGPDVDELTLLVGHRAVVGWESIRVARGAERLPNDFEIALTEKYPGEIDVVIEPGSPCVVILGDQTVLTGYIDRYVASIAGDHHEIRIIGRGKTSDLVDCSIEWPGGQLSNTTVLDVAQKLGAPYGITATASSAIDFGPPIPRLSVNFGETPLELLERLARYRELLIYEDAFGNLVLNQVGTGIHKSGIVEGSNVQEATVEFTMDQRYSEYIVRVSAFDLLTDLSPIPDFHAVANDPNVKRHRRRTIIAEADEATIEIVAKRAEWEAARRFGRSFAVRVTVDSWRDGAGMLWEPNRLIPVTLPTLKIVKKLWVISEVAYERAPGRGTTATLLIMPPQAFAPKPIVILPQPLREPGFVVP